MEQKVFCPTFHALYTLPLEQAWKVRGNRPAQTALSNQQAFHPLVFYMGFYPTTSGFYLGKLRHDNLSTAKPTSYRDSGHKKPRDYAGVSGCIMQNDLLNFAFLIHHMLAGDWIVLLLLQLIRGGALVFVSGIEVPCTG